MKIVDQTGHYFELAEKPHRIISVVPSQTELLFDLGLNDEVIGVTKFCIHPNSWWKEKTRVGGTKNLSIAKIRELKPDLIIANKEENNKEQIEVLQKEFNVWTSDIKNLSSALQMLRSIGQIVEQVDTSTRIIEKIESEFATLQLTSKNKAIYLIWNNPIMTVGGDTFIDDMMEKAGFINLTHDQMRYPVLSEEALIQLNPEVLLLSSEPYPFKEKDVEHFKTLLPQSKIVIVDGEMFSWYGSRLMKAPLYFLNLHTSLLNVH